MKHVDAAVIGAGVSGCFAARSLTKRNISVLVLEEREDVCTGVTKANSGIIYSGCDNHPGSLKAGMCVRANEGFGALCRDLGVPFSRCGSLMVSVGPRGEKVLRKKFRNGTQSGVKGMRILTKEEVLLMEPGLSPKITAALYVPGTGTVNPWELGIAAYENAQANGAEFLLNCKLLSMERTQGGFLLKTERTCGGFRSGPEKAGSARSGAEAEEYGGDSGADGEMIFARTVINCAGLSSDAVREMLMVPTVRIFPDAADYIVLDDMVQGFVNHIIFHEPEEKKKGLTLVPTTDGKLLIGPTERDRDTAADGAVSLQGLTELEELCREIVPGLPLSEQIRTFSALRPNPYFVEMAKTGGFEKDNTGHLNSGGIWLPQDRSIHDFMILHEDGLISLIGIKTPGLTCAAELGEHCACLAAETLGNPGPNPSFDPIRKAPVRVHGMDEAERAAIVRADPAYGEIACICGDISRGEIRDAILRGAVTLDGVKRRTGSSMGCCQGARCMKEIMEMLSAAGGIPPEEVTKDGAGTRILR